ncbi:MAG: 3-hydroxyacyl-ACP dehydratase FabZ [Methylacidiphilales bacterium]|nr:3-hydroxyacyl-ACP dehydratase FabZ [Candidatus Methylacidiphilales bacterium]
MSSRFDTTNEILGIEKIVKYLPHRYPFLLIDRVVEFIASEKIVTQKNISFSDPVLQGHYPGFPIYPGAYIMEAMAQSSALLAAMSWDTISSNEFLLLKVDDLKYRRLVRPGDVMFFEVTLQGKRHKPPFLFFAKVYVNDLLTAEGNLLCTVR